MAHAAFRSSCLPSFNLVGGIRVSIVRVAHQYVPLRVCNLRRIAAAEVSARRSLDIPSKIDLIQVRQDVIYIVRLTEEPSLSVVSHLLCSRTHLKIWLRRDIRQVSMMVVLYGTRRP